MSQQSSLPVRLWRGFWNFIDGTRRLLINLIFLVIMIFLVRACINLGDQFTIESGTALVLDPYGYVVEEYTSAPIDRAIGELTGDQRPETRLRDMTTAIQRAKDDSRISHLVIDPDYMLGIGLASLKELDAAISEFKTTGKTVIAKADYFSQHQYYLAALADEVWLNERGMVWLDGYSNYRNFYKDGLDKLAVEINLFRVGEYKSAMEPYIRNDMSPEAKEAGLLWINSLWQQYLEGVARNRGLLLEDLSRSINNTADRILASDGDLANYALDLGLVDKLMTRPEMRSVLISRIGASDADDSYQRVNFRRYLDTTDLQIDTSQGGKIVVLTAEGEIVSGSSDTGRVGAESLSVQIRDVAQDPEVGAVVLRINSPGGDAFASELIRREMQLLREQGKAVVVSMGNVAASGGYWIAMAADEVWASPATITGSIGVFGMIPTFGNTLDKVGIHTDGIGTTPLAGTLRLDRSMSEDLKSIFQRSIENTYEEFINLVSLSRNLDPEEVHESARGRVWSGIQASERDLVDRTGTLQQAIESAARMAGYGNQYVVDWMEPEMTAFERFIIQFTGSVWETFDVKLETVPPLVRTPFVQKLLNDLRFIAGKDGRLTVAAHCLCELE